MLPGDLEERDGLTGGPARRRGAGLNPGNRFEKVRLHVLGDERERLRQEALATGVPDDAPNVPVELIADQYNLTAIPRMFLIDRKGVLRSVEGRENYETLIPELLKEGA